MSRATDNYVEGTDLFLGLTRLRVDAKVAIKVNISKIQPGDSGTAGNSRSNLPAWLAASKVITCARARARLRELYHTLGLHNILHDDPGKYSIL